MMNIEKKIKIMLPLVACKINQSKILCKGSVLKGTLVFDAPFAPLKLVVVVGNRPSREMMISALLTSLLLFHTVF